MKRYKSLFNRLERKHGKEIFNLESDSEFLESWQKYEGTLGEVLELLVSSSDELEENIIFNAPRIIRAVINYKINSDLLNVSGNYEDLLSEATKLAINLYKEGDVDGERICDFQRLVYRSGADSIFNMKLEQDLDEISWNACSPEFSEVSVRKIMRNSRDGGVLFLALAHGGIPSGIDVYLRYCDEAGNNGSTFYPVRFSRESTLDNFPNLSMNEKKNLSYLSNGKKVIIFDEDSITGETIRFAHKYFDEKFSEKKGIMQIVNSDYQKS